MNTFSKSLLAVTGLAFSLAACAPAFKGEGSKKPDIGRIQEKARAKAEKKAIEDAAIETAELAELPRIKSIKLKDAAEDVQAFSTKVVVTNVDDVEDKDQKTIETSVKVDGKLTAIDPIEGTHATYTLELQCVENCAMVVGVLTAQKKTAVPSAEAAAEEKAEDKTEDKDETKISTQTGTTAPEQIPANVEDSTAVRTGIIVNSAGKILGEKVLDVKATLEENVSIMEEEAAKKAKVSAVVADKK